MIRFIAFYCDSCNQQFEARPDELSLKNLAGYNQILCRKCGEYIDLDDDQVKQLLMKVIKADDFGIENRRGDIVEKMNSLEIKIKNLEKRLEKVIDVIVTMEGGK